MELWWSSVADCILSMFEDLDSIWNIKMVKGLINY